MKYKTQTPQRLLVNSLSVAMLIGTILLAVSCETKKPVEEKVWVSEQKDDSVYWTNTRETVRAAYYNLTDQSQSFVRLILPDGTALTLPQAKAASGVRYSDEFSYTWWTKGESAFLEKRGSNGEWEVVYRDCYLIKPSSEP